MIQLIVHHITYFYKEALNLNKTTLYYKQPFCKTLNGLDLKWGFVLITEHNIMPKLHSHLPTNTATQEKG